MMSMVVVVVVAGTKALMTLTAMRLLMIDKWDKGDCGDGDDYALARPMGMKATAVMVVIMTWRCR